VDRHSSLSLNLRPQFTDQECQDLPAPYPDSIWESQEPLHSTDLGPVEERLRVFGYKIVSLDVLGVLVPIFRYYGNQ
jgi:xylanolytic transcriptional activator XlnR